MGTLRDLGYSSGGKRGGVNQKRSELKSAVGKAKKDKGLLARAKGIADQVGLDELANPVMRALSTLDLPRATVVSGVAELADTIGGGPNTHNFGKGVTQHEGVGDYIHTGNIWADRALGFAGDVVADPLTYLTVGTGRAAGAIGRGAAELSAKQVAKELLEKGGEKLGKEGAERAAAKALRHGATSLSREELESIGAKSGARFGVGRAKVAIPGTEGVARGLNTATRPLRTAAKATGIGDRFAVVPELAKMRRSANPRDVVHAFLFEDALTNTLGRARGLRNKLTVHLDELAGQYKDVDGETLLRAIEGHEASRVAAPEWKGLHDFFEAARTEASEITGREIPRIEDYAPWKLSQELRDEMAEKGGRLGSSSKKVGPERRSLLRAEDADFMGVKLKGETHAARRAEIEAIARKKFGDDYKQVLRDNPWELAHAYVHDMERYVQRHGLDKALLDRGVTQRTPYKPVVKGLKKQERLVKLADDLFGSADAARDEARAAREAIPEVHGGAANDVAAAETAQLQGDVAGAQATAAGNEVTEARRGVKSLTSKRSALTKKVASMPAEVAVEADRTALDDALEKLGIATSERDALVEAAKVETAKAAEPIATAPAKVAAAADDMVPGKVGKYGTITGLPEGYEPQGAFEVVVDVGSTTSKNAPPGHSKLVRIIDERRQFQNLAHNLTEEEAQRYAAQVTRELTARTAAPAAEAAVSKGVTEAQLRVIEKALGEADAIRKQGTRSAIDQANARYKRIAEFFNQQGMEGVRKRGQERLLQTSEDLHDAIAVARQSVLPPSEVPTPRPAPPVPELKPKSTAKLTAAERKVTKARDVVTREQALFDQGGAARRVNAERETVAAELAEINERIAAGKGDISVKLERQRAHLEHATRLWSEAEAHRASGNAALAKVAELEGTVQAAEARAVGANETASKLLDKAERIVKVRHSEKAAIADMEEQGLKQAIEGRWGEPWVADAVLEVEKFLQPDEVGRLLNTADQVLARWKAYSLLSPGFHVRNFIGGMFNNSLAGVHAEMYWRYGRAARAYAKGGIEAVDGELREGFQAMLDHGVTGGGNVRDLADVAPDLGRGSKGLLGAKNRKIDPTSLDNIALAKNRAAAETVENHLRGTLFLDQWLKHSNVDRALESVAKYHFDYGMLAPWEQKYARRVIPFYTWSRKNFPLQIENMLRQPGKYTRYLHAKRNLELGVPEDELVPEYYADLLAIRSPFKSKGGDRIYLTPDLPFRDLAEQFNVDRVMGQLNPAIKVPLEANANKQFYSGLPFKEGVQEAPTAWAPIMAVLAPMNGKFGLPKVHRANGKFMLSDKDAYKIEQTLPLLGRLRRAVPSEDRYQSRVLTTYLSLIGGIGARTLDNGQKYGELSRRVKAVQSMNKQNEQLTQSK